MGKQKEEKTNELKETKETEMIEENTKEEVADVDKEKKEVEEIVETEVENQEEKEVKEKEIIEEKEIEKEQQEAISQNDTDKMQEELLEKRLKNKKRIIKTTIISVSIIIVLTIISTIFALMNINNSNIISGVWIQDVDVSGLSQEEAKSAIEKMVEDASNKNIILKHDEYEKILVPKDIEANYNVNAIIEEAYQVGRKGNIFQNNYTILKALLFKEKLTIEITMSEEKLEGFTKDMELNIPGAVVQSSYTIDGNHLIITKGMKGLSIKKEELKEEILEDLQTNLDAKDQIIEIPVKETEPESIDIEKIYGEVHKEPQNAYYVKEPFQLFTHVDGVDFAISIEEAKEMLKEEKEEYSIPLKITPPEITTQKLGAEAFPELLSTFTTRFDASNANRATNISIACRTIDGTVLMPGETFSFNSTLGPRTLAKGYKEAGAYLDGQVVESYGGGICQVSSTLYNAVLLSNLEIVTRYNHSSLVSYLDPSRDAAVSYGGKDFVFKNSRTYPIKINASAKNGILRMEIHGIKEEVEYQVVIESKVTKSIPYTIKYEDNSSIETGKEVVKTKGTNGAKSVAYKVLKLNGAVVSRTELSQDTYNPMQRVVQRGTGAVTTIPEEIPQIVDEPVQ